MGILPWCPEKRTVSSVNVSWSMEMPEFLDCTTVWRMALLGLKPLMIYFSMFRVCAMMLSSITSICFVNDVDTFIFKCPCNRTWHVRVWHEGSLSISKFLVRLARGLVGGGEPLVALTFASWAFLFFQALPVRGLDLCWLHLGMLSLFWLWMHGFSLLRLGQGSSHDAFWHSRDNWLLCPFGLLWHTKPFYRRIWDWPSS